MLLTVLLALQQSGTAPASFPVARVEIVPSAAEVEVGGQVRLAARALDAGGEPVKDAAIEWFVASDVGSVDASGLVTGGYAGVARVDVAPSPAKLVVGTRLTLVGTAYSKHGDRRADLVSFWSSNQKVVSVTPDGRLHALA